MTRADGKDDECRRLEFIITADAGRYRAMTERLAAPARSTAYSAAARFALEGLARLGQSSPLAAIIVPPGSDVIGYAAHLHLSSPRDGGPFIVVDGASPEEQAEARWNDEQRSPLRLADGGTLLLTSVLALPLPTQETVALALSRRAAHAPRSSILPPGVVIALPAPLDELVRSGKLSATLARWFKGSELALPSLAERTEDLRALCLDVLSRRCLELGKEPLGIDAGALRSLLEHTWPQNEVELAAVLSRAAALAEGPTLSASDLTLAGFNAKPAPAAELTPLPAAPKRRASRRPLRG